MHPTLPLLEKTDFPRLRRGVTQTLQVNLGYRCNQSCLHCHVNAGPKRREQMSRDNIDSLLAWLASSDASTVDLTGGAPELHPDFRFLVEAVVKLGIGVIDRCNLTILEEPGQGDLAGFLAAHGVRISASLPCYLQENVDGQRGAGVYVKSIRALKRLNGLGYGVAGSGLELDLVYNPPGPQLPPAQAALEEDYRRELWNRHGVEFTRLLTIANMPIQRFGSTLVSNGQFDDYMALLRGAHQDQNLDSVMCRTLLSVDWQGRVYDCDFNQMLGLPLQRNGQGAQHIRDLVGVDLRGQPITVADHCYGCTAGQGSGCGGALER